METFFEVLSINKPRGVEITGFEKADDGLTMIKWLGKGEDFRQFVINDIEFELYLQDKGSQLLSVKCLKKPFYQTKALKDIRRKDNIVTLKDFSVTFYLIANVRASNGNIWELHIEHNYQAKGLDSPNKLNVTLKFSIVEQRLIKDVCED